jgi:ubiquinone/menaquinone biosynthesis C-methylase UbiE
LRVPSDNVPRTRPPTSPPAPVPEDPALAMSIAYSFSNDGSGPVPRASGKDDDHSGPMPTVIDSVSAPVEQADFEMKTREMSSVDLQALGLEDPSNTLRTIPMQRVSAPNIVDSAPATADAPWGDARQARTSKDDDDVDVTVDTDQPDVITKPERPITPRTSTPPQKPARTPGPSSQRLQTVALSDEDLEEVRAQTHPVPPVARPSVPPPTKPSTATVDDVVTSAQRPPPATKRAVTPEEPISVADIDIQELAERAESSGEIEVAVDDAETLDRPAPTPAPPPAPPVRPSGRSTSSSQPPPLATAQTQPMPSMAERKSGTIDVAHKPPPAPPKSADAPRAKGVQPGVVAAVVSKEPSRPQQRGKPWFADLFDEDYLRTLPYLTPQATQAEAEYIIQALGTKPGAQVLDVGCGYGRHAMELAARGFRVFGLDLSTQLLVRGGEEAERRGLSIEFVHGDMREIAYDSQFEGAYCVFSTFGYFDDETNKKTLANVSRALKPGGRLLLEILNRDYLIQDLPTRVWWEGDGCVVLEEVELNYFSSRVQVNRSVVFDDGRQLEQEISVRAYSLHEVGKLMHAAGFRVLEVSGGYQTKGRFFGNQSRHIIVLAERRDAPVS